MRNKEPIMTEYNYVWYLSRMVEGYYNGPYWSLWILVANAGVTLKSNIMGCQKSPKISKKEVPLMSSILHMELINNRDNLTITYNTDLFL